MAAVVGRSRGDAVILGGAVVSAALVVGGWGGGVTAAAGFDGLRSVIFLPLCVRGFGLFAVLTGSDGVDTTGSVSGGGSTSGGGIMADCGIIGGGTTGSGLGCLWTTLCCPNCDVLLDNHATRSILQGKAARKD